MLRSLCLAALVLASTSAAAETTLRLVLLNDLDDKDRFPAVAAAVAEARAAAGASLLLHAGDALSPSVLASLDEGAHIVALMNALGVDAFTPGNHEFDFGPEVFAARMAEAEFPVLSANITDGSGARPAFLDDRLLVQVGDVTVGLFGLTSPDATVRSSPGDYRFAEPVTAAEEAAAALRGRGAEFVVALTHTGLADDLALARADVADVVASGDDHHLLVHYDGTRVVLEGTAQGRDIPVVDLAFSREDGALRWEPGFAVIRSDALAPDPAMAERVAALEARLDDALAEEIAVVEVPLDTRRATVRTGESNFGNLVADAMLAATGADLAVTNGGGIRGDRLYEAGTVLSARDVFAELPFGNKTVVLELTGAELLAAFENGVSRIAAVDGRFLQVSHNVRLTIDADAEPGARIVEATVDGAPIEPDATYRLATNDYLARGGDGFDVLAAAEVVLAAPDGRLMAAQVVDHVRDHGADRAREGRIRVR